MSQASIRVYTSKLTDIRRIETLAQERGVAVERVVLSMGSRTDRNDFHQMQERQNWQTLPMIFAAEEFLGGEAELEQWLAGLDKPAEEPAWPGRGAISWTLAGIAPFYFGLALSLSPAADWAQPLWLLYAALILAFMCGTQWMDRVRQTGNGGILLLTTIPVLAVVPASLLSPSLYAVVIALALLSLLPLDWQSLQAGRINSRYWQLRLIATSAATLSLVLGSWLI